jgi:hypothetical protein
VTADSRNVRLIYAMHFDTTEPDACPDCLKVLEALRRGGVDAYRREALRVQREIEEYERKRRERADAEVRARRFLEGRADEPGDDYDDEYAQPDLMELLKRADREELGASDTA